MSLSKYALPKGTITRAARPAKRSLRLISNPQSRRLSTEKEEKGVDSLGGRPQGKSFQGQLWESTTARIQRQKEERSKYSHEGSPNSAARNTAILFSEYTTTVCHMRHAKYEQL